MSSNSTVENPAAMGKQKETIAQVIETTVPDTIVLETLKLDMQKRQKPNPSDGGLIAHELHLSNEINETTFDEQTRPQLYAQTQEALAALESLDSTNKSTSSHNSSVVTENASTDEHIDISKKTTDTSNSIQRSRPRPRSSSVSLDHCHELYVSKFPNNTTSSMIRDFLSSKGIAESINIKIHALIPRNTDPSSLSFVSFKIDAIPHLYSI